VLGYAPLERLTTMLNVKERLMDIVRQTLKAGYLSEELEELVSEVEKEIYEHRNLYKE
jgi:ethanolamine utilization protein EutA (predicted chaperonin)